MKPMVYALLQLMTTAIRSGLSLQLEIVALRHQFAVYQRTPKRPQIPKEISALKRRALHRQALGKVVQFREVGGLHHHYERLAA